MATTRRALLSSLSTIIALTLAGCTSAVQKTNALASGTPSAPWPLAATGDTGVATASPASSATFTPIPPSPTLPAPTATAVQPTPTVVPPSPTSEPPSPSPILPTPTPTIVPLAILAKGFGAGKFGSSYAFILQNPMIGQSAENVQCQIAAFDKDGSVLTTATDLIAVIFPGQEVGIAGRLAVDTGQKIDRLDVQVKPDKYEQFQPQSSFTLENSKFISGSYGSKVTGIVKSPYRNDIKDVEVTAIVSDAARKIFGGSFTLINFVPAGGQAAFEVSLDVIGTPANVDVYAMFSTLSLLSS